MKRIAFIVFMLLASLSAGASTVHYFTQSQARRAVDYLNRQSEIMIYCGYDYEIETYVLLNEVWAEKVNSAFYELWVYGYDAYTGDEVYMPIDLQCIWLYSAGRMYNAAQYLRFRTSGNLHRPALTWTVPAYNTFARVHHPVAYTRTYHYDIHLHGWMPPAPPQPSPHGPAVYPLPPYYMRAPQTPPPAPIHVWTPGTDRPVVNANSQPSRAARTTPTTPSSSNSSSANPTRSSSANPTRSSSTQTKTPTSTTPTRSSSSATPTRSGSSSTATPTRSSSTTSANATRSSSSTSKGNSTSTATATPTRSSSTTSSNATRSSSSTTKNTSTRTSTSTPTRSSSSTSSNATRSSSSTTKSNSTSSSTSTPTRSSSTSRSSTKAEAKSSSSSSSSSSAGASRSSSPTRSSSSKSTSSTSSSPSRRSTR